MMNYFFVRNCLLFVCAVIMLAGCSESDERRHPLYIKALQDRQSGKGEEAAEKLCELLKRRPRSVYAHKLLASVYDEMLNDPATALYHYKAYLSANPEAEDTEEVKAWILQAEKRCYALLHERFGRTQSPAPPQPQSAAEETPAAGSSNPVKPVPDPPAEKSPSASPPAAELLPAAPDPRDQEIAELKLKLAQYQARYRVMREEVEKSRRERFAARTPAVKSPKNGAAVPAAGPRQYKVLPGDTPGSIARKLYGRSSLYYVIMQANPQVDARKLRPGMILNIPDINNKSNNQGAAK